jgi:outer membrane protein
MPRILFSILLSILAINTQASDDLITVYQQVLDSDPELKAAVAGHRANLTLKDQARSLLLPNADFSADTTENSQDSSISGESDFNDNGYRLSITQPIFRYDSWVQQTQADLRIQQSETDLSATQQEVMLKAAQRYFDLLSAQADLEFAQSEKTAIAKQLEQAQKRFEVGLIAITDVHEAQAAYDLATASEITARNLLANAAEALTEITGSTHTRLAKLGPELPLHRPDPDSMEEWTDIALRQNLQLRALTLATKIVREDIRLQRAGHYPTLDIVAAHNNADRGGDFGRETTTDSIALQLNVPLYKGGRTTAQVEESVHLYSQAQENLEGGRRSVLRKTRDAYRGVINGIGQVQALKQARVSNKSALETTQAGFEVGTRTIVDVLLAQRGLFGSIRDYDQARHEYILNLLRLKLATGTLSPKDLSYFNQWLQQ